MDTQPAAPAALSCSSCGTDLHGQRWNWMCCQPCEDWIRDQLNTIEHLWQDLPAHLVPGRGPGGTRVSGSPQPGRIPVSEAVINLTGPGGAHDRLARHDLVIRTARGQAAQPVTGTADHRLAATIGLLRRHLPWAAEHVDLYDLAAELRDLAGEMRHATGHRAETVAFVQPCPVVADDGAACPGTLRYDREQETVRCGDCNTPVDSTRWLALAAARRAA